MTWILAFGLGGSLVPTSDARANTLTLGLDLEFSGGQAPAGPTPWVTATFDDSFGGANTVRLTMNALNLSGNGGNAEFLEEMTFNFDPGLDPTQLTLTDVSSPTVGPIGTFTGVDAFMSDGDGDFDIRFDFPTSNNQARFGPTEVVVYDLTYIAPIDVSSFDFFSTENGGRGTFKSAAHVQNAKGAGSGGSGWIGVIPEPSTVVLLAGGLLGLAAIGRKRR